MGDAGSLTVGFVLGFLAVMLTQSPGTTISPMLPMLVLALPVIDTIWVMVRRMASGLNPFVGDLSHVHHKFLDLGFQHRMTVVIIHALTLFWAGSALLLHHLPEYLLLVYLMVTVVVFYVLLRYLQFHHDRFGFLMRDTSGGLRSTVLFQRTTVVVDRLMPLLCGVMLLYALLAVICMWGKGIANWPVSLLVFIVGVGIRRWVPATSDFHLLLVYAAAILAVFAVWPQGEAVLLGFSPKRLGDAFLLGATILAILKLLFHREGEFSIGRADYLVMLMLTLLTIGIHETQVVGSGIAGPMLRAIAFIVAIRAYATSGLPAQRLLINAALVLLAIVTVIGLSNVLL
jgi:UDP-GlcNAc:undecaprenyl-phosphate GlcNAc-1-phosphate transferase